MPELVTISLKITPELRDGLKERAAKEGKSVSALVLEGVYLLIDDRIAVLEREIALCNAKIAEAALAARPGLSNTIVGRHASGPMLPPTLAVRGEARPVPKKAQKSGR